MKPERPYRRPLHRTRNRGGQVMALAAIAMLAAMWLVPHGTIVQQRPDLPAARQLVFGLCHVAFGLFVAAIGMTKHGDPLEIIAAGRNRYSLSRLQMLLWTWIVVATVVAAVICRAWGLDGLTGATDPLAIGIDPELVDAMGIGLFTGAAAPALLSLKAGGDGEPIDERSVSRRMGEPVCLSGTIVARPSTSRCRITDLVSGDEAANAATIDLSKVQQLIISAGIVLVYLLSAFTFFGSAGFVPQHGGLLQLPGLSPDLVKLLLVSHAGYLGYKAVPKAMPPGAAGGLPDGPPPTPAQRTV